MFYITITLFMLDSRSSIYFLFISLHILLTGHYYQHGEGTMIEIDDYVYSPPTAYYSTL